jgi:hypothetical protein
MEKYMSSFLDDLLDEKTSLKWVDQNSEEWDRIRLGRFTASEFYRLMEPSKREMTEKELKARPKSGKGSSAKYIYDHDSLSDSARTYIFEKVSEVLTGQARQIGFPYAILWGKEHEEEAAELFASRTGFDVQKVGFFPYTQHAGGSPDRLVNDNAILEIKAPYDSVNQVKYLMLTDQWDLKREYFPYWVQCQANMMFTERNLTYFCTFDPRMKDDKHKLTQIEIKADPEFHDLMRKKIELAVKEKLQLLSLLS